MKPLHRFSIFRIHLNKTLVKPRNTSLRSNALVLAGSIATLLASHSLHAATFTWDADGTYNNGTLGGTGTWDTASLLWDDGAAADVAWPNTNPNNADTAIFSGTAGTVTLGAPIFVNALTFSTTGYTIERSTDPLHILTFNGTTPTINTGVAGTLSTINAKLTGTANLNGADTITFGGIDDNGSFAMVVNSGVTAILAKTSSSSVHAVGGGGITVNAGGVAKLGGTGGDQIFNSGNVTLVGGLFDLDGRSESINSLSGTTGTVDNTAAGTATLTIGNTAGTGTFNGTIQNTGGALSLTKIGTGTATLGGVNTFSGATTVTAGGLVLSGTGSLASSALQIGIQGANSSRILTVSPTASGTTTRSNGLTWNGGGPGGTNAFNFNVTNGTGGNVIENFGALTLNSGLMRTSTAGNATGNTRVVFDSVTRSPGTALYADRGVTNGTVGANSIASQTAASANIVFTSAPTLSGNGGTGADISILPWAVSNQTLTTYDSVNGLRPLNTGTEMANLTSGMSVGSGTAGQNARINVAAITISADTKINSLYGNTTSAILTFGSASTKLTVSSGAVQFTVNQTIGASVNNGVLDFGSEEGHVFVENARTATINSVITGSNGVTINLDNVNATTAKLVLAGANTYTGFTTLLSNGPTNGVRLTNKLALQNTTLDYNNYGGTLAFGDGGTTGLTAYTFGGLRGAQNLSLLNNNTTVAAVALNVGGNGDSTTYSGVLSGALGSIIKTGAGTLTLSGANTYTGATTASAGTLVLSGSSTTSAISINGGTNTTVRATSTAATGSGYINFATGSTNALLQLHVDGGGTINFANTLGGNSTLNSTIDVGNNGSGTNGVIRLTGTGNTGGVGNSTYNITGSNGYSLRLDTIRSSAGSAGTTTFNPTTTNVALGTYTNAGAATGTYVLGLGGTSAGNSVFGVISNGTTTTGVTKSNTSTWTLSTTNTYNGPTAVNGGILKVTGSIGNSAVTVTGSGSTLASGSTGTIGQSVTVNSDSVLAVGDLAAVGTATVGSGGLLLKSSSIFDWDLTANSSSSGFDTLATSNNGNLSVSAGAIFRVVLGGAVDGADPFWTSGTQSWDVFNVNGTGTTTMASLGHLFDTIQVVDATTDSLFTGVNGSFTFTGSTLTWSAVPEPSSSLAGLLIGAGLLRRRRSAK